MFKRLDGMPNIKKLPLSRVTLLPNQVVVLLVVVVVLVVITTLPRRYRLLLKAFLNHGAMLRNSIRRMIIAAAILVSHSQT
jgi:hypothetical protein